MVCTIWTWIGLYLVQKVDLLIKKEEVQRMIRKCIRCQSIDLAPTIHDPGEIGTTINWRRLAINIMHCSRGAYLSMIDCRPRRLAVWREFHVEIATVVVEELEKVIHKRGPVVEVIIDNGSFPLGYPPNTVQKMEYSSGLEARGKWNSGAVGNRKMKKKKDEK